MNESSVYLEKNIQDSNINRVYSFKQFIFSRVGKKYVLYKHLEKRVFFIILFKAYLKY